MKQLLIISGKGGTGKTSITGSFATLAKDAILCDCDVDAADLHLLLRPQLIQSNPFISGVQANIIQELCIHCGKCYELCRFDAIKKNDGYTVEDISCEGCGVCHWNCPVQAIELKDCICGEHYISNTRYGLMSHAKLKPGAENSGKLVAYVREQSRKLAKEHNKDLIIIDGPPGVGCPVIASITGVDAILIVAEPSQSSFHDLVRVVELAKRLDIKPLVCINKYNINEKIANIVYDECCKLGLEVLAKIPYDKNFTSAQTQGKTIIEYQESNITPIIENLWEDILIRINQ